MVSLHNVLLNVWGNSANFEIPAEKDMLKKSVKRLNVKLKTALKDILGNLGFLECLEGANLLISASMNTE